MLDEDALPPLCGAYNRVMMTGGGNAELAMPRLSSPNSFTRPRPTR